jgi:hypothetical protein
MPISEKFRLKIKKVTLGPSHLILVLIREQEKENKLQGEVLFLKKKQS